jgi:UDP-N-acetylmuramoyl-tripeptide--D-alanyl-D-alanine ligase
MIALHERLDVLARAAGGRLLSGRPDLMVSGLFSDTRTPLPGGLFVALRGDRFDGNAFVRDAISKLGAAAVLLDRPEAAQAVPNGAGAILVKDSREGYLGIAARHRQILENLVWFGVTGSVGKSTTKEMLAHILSSVANWNVHKAKSSFNNAVGLSQTILGANAGHRAVVLELGTNHPGEIRQLSAVASPHIAVITCAAESHLEAFGTVANVAREKGDILTFQSGRDTAVLNADDPHAKDWKMRARGNVVTFGVKNAADVSARQVKLDGQGRAEFLVRRGDEIAECRLTVPGIHQASNALAAIAAACAAGVPLIDAARGAGTFEGVTRRFSVHNIRGATIIDDAYNANPASFAAALQTVAAIESKRKILVAGDMLELGAQSIALHEKLGEQIATSKFDRLITVGPLASVMGDSAVVSGMPAAQRMHCETPEAASEALLEMLCEGDAVLIKGSHGAHLEDCVERLLN